MVMVPIASTNWSFVIVAILGSFFRREAVFFSSLSA